MTSRWMALVTATALLGSFTMGCKRDSAPGTTRTTGGSVETRENAYDREYNRPPYTRTGASMRFDLEVSRLASARCEREVRCNNVGSDHKFVSREQCEASINGSLQSELNAWDCQGGVDTKELEECLTEIRNEDCGNPLDTIGRLAACRSSDMCKALR